MSDSNDIAVRMRAALAASQKSQADLAAALGVGQPAVSQWLKGLRAPDTKSLQRFASVVGVDPEFSCFSRGAVDLNQIWLPNALTTRQNFVGASHPSPRMAGERLGIRASLRSKPNPDYFVREVGQNVLDAAVEPTVSLRFTIVRLTGSRLERWLNAFRWDELRAHVEASAASGQQVRGSSSDRSGHGRQRGVDPPSDQ